MNWKRAKEDDDTQPNFLLHTSLIPASTQIAPRFKGASANPGIRGVNKEIGSALPS